MSDPATWLKKLLEANSGSIPLARIPLFEQFAGDERNIKVIQEIFGDQQLLMERWKLHSRISDIKEQALSIPNAKAGVPYDALIDFEKLGWSDVISCNITGLEETGLAYDAAQHRISGIPEVSGNIKLVLHFRLASEADDTALNEKAINLVINPDPKSLWKEISTDPNALYGKEDTVHLSGRLGDKNIVAASKRGRSHANTGAFREDDFACRYYEATGWSIVAVADGAGSARLSREGSRIACQTVLDYFSVHLATEAFIAFDELIAAHYSQPGEAIAKKLNHLLYSHLGTAALEVRKKLAETAALSETDIRDFHTTLIFALVRKYEFGYAILSFGVGDCPIALLSTDLSGVVIMNPIDAGDYGGGTRFITMPEIFQDERLGTRFGFQLVPDFAYLIMMTDGIYDPKFAVEANLEKPEKWKEFLSDLQGNNEAKAAVDFTPDNPEAGVQLAAWMDFWSPGNHDDRTLVILY